MLPSRSISGSKGVKAKRPMPIATASATMPMATTASSPTPDGLAASGRVGEGSRIGP
jgi:hypothetical protein